MQLLLAYALEEGADGRPRVDINAMNEHGATALHEARHWLRHVTQEEVNRLIAQRPESVRGITLDRSIDRTTRAGSERPYASPYYWAAFMLVGG